MGLIRPFLRERNLGDRCQPKQDCGDDVHS
jgi:hypothetical protein